MTLQPLISIISPVYGCRDCLEALADRVEATFEGTNLVWELVLVDDRAPDTPWPLIEQMAVRDSRIRGLRLARNHGQHLAIWAGLEIAKGDWVAVIDCDLQDDPDIIPTLYDRAARGDVDAVIVDRGEWSDTKFRRMVSRAYSKVLRWLTGFPINNNIGNFGLYSRRMVDILVQFRDKEVFLPVMVLLTGLPRAFHTVNRSGRHEGDSSYNIMRLLQLAVAIIIRFSDRPLKLSVLVGLAFSSFSAIFSVLLVAAWATGAFTVPGWTSIILSVWFLSGLILAVLGVHGFYVGRIFREVQDRPRIVVEKTTESAET
jgi:dolichol-phosphate mannosyltransferase